jgi:uncharacterized membrane protein
MIYSRRYVVLPKSKEILFLSFFSYCFFHTPVLHTLSLTSGFNLNYMWTPPPSKRRENELTMFNMILVKLLLDLGPSYRIVMYGVAFILKFITRFICVETILTLMSRKQLQSRKNSNNNSQIHKKSKKIN